MTGFSFEISSIAEEFWDSLNIDLSFWMWAMTFCWLGYRAMAALPSGLLEIIVFLEDHWVLYLKVYPKKSSWDPSWLRQYCLVWVGDNHNPLSLRNELIAGTIYLPRMFWLLVMTTKSSAYLITWVDIGIRVIVPSVCWILILCSLAACLVQGKIDSFTVFSNPFNVKFASVGEIIPLEPWGVPGFSSGG